MIRVTVFLGIFLFSRQEVSLAQIKKSPDSLREKLTIKDESKYSEHFLRILRNFIQILRSDARYKLNDNTIEVSSKKNRYENHSTSLPSLPQQRKWYTLLGEKEGVIYELRLFQKGYAEVEFQILLRKELTVIYRKNGLADASPSFLIAGEMHEDDKTGQGYTVSAYLSGQEGCEIWFSIGSTREGLKGIVNEIPCESSEVIEMIGKHPTLREVK